MIMHILNSPTFWALVIAAVAVYALTVATA